MFSIFRLLNKLPEEKIIKVLRRDSFVLFKRVVLFGLLAVLPLAFFSLMVFIFPSLLDGTITYPLLVLGGSAFYFFIWLFFFFSFIDYYLDIWIITDKRIIDIRQQGFFSRMVAEVELDKVQDVTSEIHGFLPTIFKYGGVRVQTAGEEGNIVFQEVPNPDAVRETIMKLVEKNK